ncbi:uncharacterized protein DUF2569 [Acinetobacter calcoaceticus]|uniref:Uncharacterized protein DUF2569 n=1 Tax=Acinetobacter calcoaceticus TaxID=471 RepID=A0A4R1Y025_ACICA|nr:uncharacterized protein DUF2569 [Acinetobacter calcoaceticus]
MNEKKELRGLGGWLILVAIGLVLSASAVLVSIYPFFEMLSAEKWEILAAFEPETFNSELRSIIFAEIGFNILLFFAFLYVIYLFFSKHYLFPKFFIAIQVVVIFYILVDSYVVSLIPPMEPMLDYDTIKSLVRALIYAAFWITYMLKSERVKQTFVEHRPVNKNING